MINDYGSEYFISHNSSSIKTGRWSMIFGCFRMCIKAILVIPTQGKSIKYILALVIKV